MNRALCLVVTLGFSSVAACKTPVSPPTPVVTTPAEIGDKLVEGGCILNSTTLTNSVTTEAESDAAPLWMRCMLEGGSVTACGAPCGDGGP